MQRCIWMLIAEIKFEIKRKKINELQYKLAFIISLFDVF